ncbi:helix-turn-helix domain-containing protein [Variovorax sp. OK605]|uniref:helix-turn-helix domain-containing protein n=1 Tax=Variovorax sp. OK605 TaxID=1855317 RepID=UPI003526E052
MDRGPAGRALPHVARHLRARVRAARGHRPAGAADHLAHGARVALLARGGQDTASVGEAVGYRSEAAFNRAFTRHAGVTPGRFRRAAAGAR